MYKIMHSFRAAYLAAILAGATSTAAAQLVLPKPTPGPLPPYPAGLELGNRKLDRQDQQTTGTGVPGEAYISAAVQKGRHGRREESRQPLWLDSDASSNVVFGLGEAGLFFNTLPTSAEVQTLRVHDQAGGVVTISQRVYRIVPGEAAEFMEASVRVDERGKLLTLPVVRVARSEDGSVIVSRDGGFAEAIQVQFRILPAALPAARRLPIQTVTIPAGTVSAAMQVQAQAGDELVVYAGGGYTPAPAEDSDVIQF